MHGPGLELIENHLKVVAMGSKCAKFAAFLMKTFILM
jgi:hypothetical protein